MPTSPPSIQIHPYDTPKPIWFTAWEYSGSAMTIKITVKTGFFGLPPVALEWPFWKFRNVTRHPSGAGVQGDLYFDRTLSLPDGYFVYDKILWPNSAVLNGTCSVANSTIGEPLTILLVP